MMYIPVAMLVIALCGLIIVARKRYRKILYHQTQKQYEV